MKLPQHALVSVLVGISTFALANGAQTCNSDASECVKGPCHKASLCIDKEVLLQLASNPGIFYLGGKACPTASSVLLLSLPSMGSMPFVLNNTPPPPPPLTQCVFTLADDGKACDALGRVCLQGQCIANRAPRQSSVPRLTTVDSKVRYQRSCNNVYGLRCTGMAVCYARAYQTHRQTIC